MKAVLDTNIFIKAFLDLEKDLETPETGIFNNLKDKKFDLILSSELEEQVLKVVKKVKDKDFVGLFRFMLWTDFQIEFTELKNKEELKKNYKEIPRKDLDIFLTAVEGNADFLVTNDREFKQEAKKIETNFQVLSGKNFYKKHLK